MRQRRLHGKQKNVLSNNDQQSSLGTFCRCKMVCVLFGCVRLSSLRFYINLKIQNTKHRTKSLAAVLQLRTSRKSGLRDNDLRVGEMKPADFVHWSQEALI